MTTWVAIPVKLAESAKTRLGAVLDPEERRFLAIRWLERTIQACLEADTVDTVVVVTADPVAQALARRHGCRLIEEPLSDGLNRAVDRAVEACRHRAAHLLVLTADLPAVEPADIEAICELGASLGSPAVVVGPDQSGRGTSALWLSPPDVIPAAFEGASAARHLDLATAAGAASTTLVRSGWHDADTPDDLMHLRLLDDIA